MASLKRIDHKSGRVVYRIVICMGYDKQGNKLVKNLTYSVNQTATPKQQEKEALKYALDMEDKIKYGHDIDAEKMTFEDFAYKWLESVKNNITYGTYRGYNQVLRDQIVPYFKGFKLAHIQTAVIEAFYKTLVDEYATGTIGHVASVLSCILNTAVRWNMIGHNPCRDARKPKKKQKEAELKYFTPNQALMFLKSLYITYDMPHKERQRTNNAASLSHQDGIGVFTVATQYKVFYFLSLLCGFRKGETLALRWGDIDFKKKEISISKSVGQTENGFDYKAPKTPTSIRTVNFPDDVLPLLREYKKEYDLLRFSLGTAWKGDNNLFIKDDGELMTEGKTYQYFIAHLKRYNKWVVEHSEQAKLEGFEELPIIPLHGLRHSCATLLNYLEMNIVDISKLLGHADCSTTMNIYAHSFEEQKRVASNKLNDFLQRMYA